jgi:hypothetical protein
MVMDAAKLKELADRCEQASGPDYDLDVAILTTALGFRDVHGDGTLFDRGNDGYWVRPEYADAERLALPSPTASLDAAMSLVPEGWRLSTLAESLTAGSSGGTRAAVLTRDDGNLPAIAFAHSLAHALCAAALRARALSISDQQSEAA